MKADYAPDWMRTGRRVSEKRDAAPPASSRGALTIADGLRACYPECSAREVE
jgi:hypothetical protein